MQLNTETPRSKNKKIKTTKNQSHQSSPSLTSSTTKGKSGNNWMVITSRRADYIRERVLT
jgi:hypothetical protein